MFKRNKTTAAPKGAMDTLIGRQTQIHGDLSFGGGLHIDGRVVGNVSAGEAGGTLSLSESGVIEGNVRVGTVVLNGQVIGEVRAGERLVLGAKAKVTGDVRYRVLQMEAGATVNGQLIHEGADGPVASAAPAAKAGRSEPAKPRIGAIAEAA